ncbi:rod shape-determining protein MreC [Nitrincola sp. MINF-07-Sa-05]|uniref:rod shape-determining protein MreC n=1 Tax=Nitrincola salilacus TaxID=3400273 RepID=UPI0039182001
MLILALFLIVADLNWPKMREGRVYLSLLITPLQWMVDLPARAADNLSDVVVDRATLVRDNERLRTESLDLERKVQLMASLERENEQLRDLLNARQRIEADVTMAELIGINPDPFLHEIILSRGTEDGVFEGQPVLDAGGVMGQVLSTAHYTSRVMLITDARTAIPVEVLRNNFRTIAIGRGVPGELEIAHVPDTADIREGDLLLTSGLGGRFPPGYPVAVVTEVLRDPGRPFSLVKASPSARLDRSRHLLLVDYHEPRPAVPMPEDSDE